VKWLGALVCLCGALLLVGGVRQELALSWGSLPLYLLGGALLFTGDLVWHSRGPGGRDD
jgi:hypothetical protein